MECKLIDAEIDSNSEYYLNSEMLPTSNGMKYKAVTNVIGFKGEPFSAFFGIIEFDENNKEIGRKIRWLNDFSGKEKEVPIVFTAKTNHVMIIYRINKETPITSQCKYSLLPIEKISLDKVDEKNPENYDSIYDYSVPLQKELTPKEELELEKNLVWIFGFPRSGTTWISTQLLSFRTKIINEPHITDHIGIIPNIEDRVPRWIDGMSGIPDYFFSVNYKKIWLYYLRKMILNRIYAQIRNVSHRVIIKEASSVDASDIISECFPQSRIIFIARDGRDVLDSIVDATQEGAFMTIYGYAPQEKKDKLRVLRNVSRLWVFSMENRLRTFYRHRKDLSYLVRYEDLVKNTADELIKLYEFLQIDINQNEIHNIIQKYSFEKIPPSLKGSGKFFRSAKPGAWKNNFSKEELTVIEEIMNKTLRTLEYIR